MLISPLDFVQLYDTIKQETFDSAERKVTIFVSTSECDSVCAVRLLQVKGAVAAPGPRRKASEARPMLMKWHACCRKCYTGKAPTTRYLLYPATPTCKVVAGLRLPLTHR